MPAFPGLYRKERQTFNLRTRRPRTGKNSGGGIDIIEGAGNSRANVAATRRALRAETGACRTDHCQRAGAGGKFTDGILIGIPHTARPQLKSEILCRLKYPFLTLNLTTPLC